MATGREASLSHDIEPSAEPKKKIVVIGGGPGGMEAARVCALRGHEVVLFEATDQLGGQIVLAAKAPWRTDMAGIADWLRAEIERLNVRIHYNTYAEADDAYAETPDIVIIASGGIPDIEAFDGGDLCHSVWDVLSGEVLPKGDVLVYDATGKSQAASCVDKIVSGCVSVEIVTPDSMVTFEVAKIERPDYLKRFYEAGVRMSVEQVFVRAEKFNNRIRVTLKNHLTGIEDHRIVDHVVIENGTVPNDDLFRTMRELSTNCGVTNLDALLAGEAQPAPTGRDGNFQMFAVGDAVSSRDIHTAILDSNRLCRTL